jgi:hypothetical protein
MSSTLIYEQSLYSDQFRRDVERGVYTEQQLISMIENNQLNEYQIQVLQELSPVLGGIGNTLKQGFQGAKNLVKNTVQGTKNAYNAGVEQTKQANNQRAQAKLWQQFDQSVQKAKILEQLLALTKAFPQDAYIKQVAQYTNKVLLDLQGHLASQYPYMGIKLPQGQRQPQQTPQQGQSQPQQAPQQGQRPAQQQQQVF